MYSARPGLSKSIRRALQQSAPQQGPILARKIYEERRMQLAQRVAVITGAAGGLGSGIARRFAREGAKVVLADVNLAAANALSDELIASGAECLALHCDVSSSASVAELFAAVDAKFSTVHILINNAALVPDKPADEERRKRHYAMLTTPLPRQSLGITREISDAEWRRFWAVNVDGVFYCTREALKRMEPQGYGRIVNIASIAGISAGSAHSPHYSATKGAVVAFTRAVAADVAGANVLVNAIAPGGVETPAFKHYLAGQTPAEVAALWQIIPIGRLGKAEEYAALATHLASDECYCVGEIINASGGVVI
jgi:3-oxoacyl-[acyl-carrier protein] reductase